MAKYIDLVRCGQVICGINRKKMTFLKSSNRAFDAPFDVFLKLHLALSGIEEVNSYQCNKM